MSLRQCIGEAKCTRGVAKRQRGDLRMLRFPPDRGESGVWLSGVASECRCGRRTLYPRGAPPSACALSRPALLSLIASQSTAARRLLNNRRWSIRRRLAHPCARTLALLFVVSASLLRHRHHLCPARATPYRQSLEGGPVDWTCPSRPSSREVRCAASCDAAISEIREIAACSIRLSAQTIPCIAKLLLPLP